MQMYRKAQPWLLQGAQWSLAATFLFFPIFMALGNVTAGLALLLSLAAGQWGARWRMVRDQPVLWWASGLFAVVLLGVLHTPAPAGDVLVHLDKYGKLLAIPILLPLLGSARLRQRCTNAFGLAMGFILLCAYASIWWEIPWAARKTLGWGGDHTMVGDYITQNIMMCFFTLWALTRGQAARRWRRAAWWLVALLAAVAITQLSQGRTGYILLAVVLCIHGYTTLRGRWRWLAPAFVAIAMVLALWNSHIARERLEQAWQEAAASSAMVISSVGGRINFWRLTAEMAAEKPVLGWGTGSYHTVWCARVVEEGWCQYGGWHPHNQYLFFWFENGLPGLLLFVLLVATPLWLARRAKPGDRPMLWGLSAILALDSLANSPLFSARESHFFVLMLLLWSARAHWRDADVEIP